MKFLTYSSLFFLILLQCQSCTDSNNHKLTGIKNNKSSQPAIENNESYLDCKNIDLNKIKDPTIIYIVYPENWKGKDIFVATPLVIFKNEKYYEPHFCQSQESSGCQINKKIDSLLLREPLYFINPNKTSKEFWINETSSYGLTSWFRPCAKIENVVSDNLLTNNKDLVINKVKLISPNERPILPKRKQEFYEGYYNDYLIGQVDINFDGICELIYCCESWEGVYYQIYSRVNASWHLVYTGSYNGV